MLFGAISAEILMKKRARGGVIIGLTCEYHTNGGAGHHHTKIPWCRGALYGGQIYSQGGEYGII